MDKSSEWDQSERFKCPRCEKLQSQGFEHSLAKYVPIRRREAEKCKKFFLFRDGDDQKKTI